MYRLPNADRSSDLSSYETKALPRQADGCLLQPISLDILALYSRLKQREAASPYVTVFRNPINELHPRPRAISPESFPSIPNNSHLVSLRIQLSGKPARTASSDHRLSPPSVGTMNAAELLNNSLSSGR